MLPIKALLNKIKWDKNLNPKDFTLAHYDRIEDKLIKILYDKIKNIEDNLMIIDNIEETQIPLHRIKIVKQKAKLFEEENFELNNFY